MKCLLDWERNVLQEYDAKYDPDDDSEDEEKMVRRKMLKEQKEQAEARRTQQEVESPTKKGKK